MHQIEQDLRHTVLNSGLLSVELAKIAGTHPSTIGRFRNGDDLGWDKASLLLIHFGRTLQPGSKSPLEIRDAIRDAAKRLASDRYRDTGITELARRMSRRESDLETHRRDIGKFLRGRNCGLKKVSEIAKAAGITIK